MEPLGKPADKLGSGQPILRARSLGTIYMRTKGFSIPLRKEGVVEYALSPPAEDMLNICLSWDVAPSAARLWERRSGTGVFASIWATMLSNAAVRL